jgi:MOSC domain-containing protein YiiM
MVKEFIEADFPGIYIRVLQQGTIKKGDQLVLKQRNDESLTVRQIYRLIYRKDINLELLYKALNDPALAESCKHDLRKRQKDE